MSTTKEKRKRGDGEVMELCISGHPVSLSFTKEPNASAAQHVRSCLIDSFLRQNAAKHRSV